MQTLLINRNSRSYVGRLSVAGQMGAPVDLHLESGTCDLDRLSATAITAFMEQPRQAVKHEDRSKPGKGDVDTR